MQYFVGLHEFHPEPLFDPSMMVHFRKRFPVEEVVKINEYVCTGKWPEDQRSVDRNDDNRRSQNLGWKKQAAGAMLEASSKGRSSYSKGLDTLYFDSKAERDAVIPLTLNGNTFRDIQSWSRVLITPMTKRLPQSP